MVEFDPKKKSETEIKPQDVALLETEDAACSAEFTDGCILKED